MVTEISAMVETIRAYLNRVTRARPALLWSGKVLGFNSRDKKYLRYNPPDPLRDSVFQIREHVDRCMTLVNKLENALRERGLR